MADNRRYRKAKRKNKNFAYIAIVILLAMIIAVVCFFVHNGNKKIFKESMVFNEINYEPSSKSCFHVFDKKIFYCTKDGMQLLNQSGEKIWTDTYTMQQPIMINAQGMVAVAEERGKAVRVYDSNGMIYQISAECPITTFTLNKNGYCLVVMETTNEYILNIYNSLGEIVFTGKYPASESIPVSVAISPDNRIFIASFIDINAINVKSNVLMYYIDKSEAKTVETGDGMFSGFSKENSIIGKFEFFEGNKFAALSDNELIFGDIGGNKGGQYEEKFTFPIDGQMTAADFAENGNAVLAIKGSGNSGDNCQLVCYGFNGKELVKKIVPDTVTSIRAYDDMFITVSGSMLSAYNYSGNVIWSFSAAQDIKQAMLFDTQNKILVAGASKMRVINAHRGDNIDENYKDTINENATAEIVTEMPAEETTETVSTKADVVNVTETTTKSVDDNDYDNSSVDDDDSGYDDSDYDDNDYDDTDYDNDDSDYGDGDGDGDDYSYDEDEDSGYDEYSEE